MPHEDPNLACGGSPGGLAVETLAALSAFVPVGPAWPDARLLDRTDLWVEADGSVWFLHHTEPWLLRRLAARLHELAELLHEQAAWNEQAAEESALLALASLGVPRVADVSPTRWLESTALMRYLRARTRL